MNPTTFNTVKVYNFETKTFSNIPAAELAPTMIGATIRGEKCWIDPIQSIGRIEPSPFQHPPFDKGTRTDIRKAFNILKEVLNSSLKRWEDGFRRDTHPQKEIGIWIHLAGIYQDFTKRFRLTPPQKKELFDIALKCSVSDYEHIHQVIAPTELTKEIVDEVIQAYYGQPKLKEEAARKPAVEYPDPQGKTPYPVEILRLPEARKQLEEADVILGVDSFTGTSCIFYGDALLRQIVEGGVGRLTGTISFIYDSRTDQLELLIAAVTAAKGSCDYTPLDESSENPSQDKP